MSKKRTSGNDSMATLRGPSSIKPVAEILPTTNEGTKGGGEGEKPNSEWGKVFCDFFVLYRKPTRKFLIIISVLLVAAIVTLRYGNFYVVSGKTIEIKILGNNKKSSKHEEKSLDRENRNPAKKNEETLGAVSCALPEVLIEKQSAECDLWEKILFPHPLYNETTKSDADGSFSFPKSPCIKFSYSKLGYQEFKGDSKESSSNIVKFHKEASKILLAITPEYIYSGSKFSYHFKFSSKDNDNEQTYLANPRKAFKFSDSLQTTIPLEEDTYEDYIHYEADTKDFSGVITAKARVLNVDKTELARLERSFGISKKIDISSLYKLNVTKKSSQPLQLQNGSIRIMRPDSPLILDGEFEATLPHYIRFTYTFPHKNTILVIQFMGVEFLIGEKDQTAISVRPTIFNNALVEPKIISKKNVITKPLPENTPISISVSYDKDKENNFTFRFVTPQELSEKKYLEPVDIKIEGASCLLQGQQPFPVKISYMLAEGKAKKSSNVSSKGISVRDFEFY